MCDQSMPILSSCKHYFGLAVIVAILTSCGGADTGNTGQSVTPTPTPDVRDLLVAKRATWYPIKSTGDTPSEQFSHRFYHAYPLDVENPDITQIIFIVHGASGSQGDYKESAAEK